MKGTVRRINQLLDEGRKETARVRRENPESDMIPFYEILLTVGQLDTVLRLLLGDLPPAEAITEVIYAIEGGVESGFKTPQNY